MPIITVYSEKGGVGKSVTTAGLARIFRHTAPTRTLVVELDTQEHQTVLLDVAPTSTGMGAFLSELPVIFPPLISGGEGMLTVDYHYARTSGFAQKLAALTTNNQMVIIDTCPALKALRHGALTAADVVVVCARPELGIDEALDDYETVITEFNRPAVLVLVEYDKRSAAHRQAYQTALHVGHGNVFLIRRRLEMKWVPPRWGDDILDDYHLAAAAIEQKLSATWK